MDLNVVIVSDHAYVSGGSAQVALGSAKALAAKGAAVTIFSAVGPPDPSLEAAGVKVVCLDERPYNRGSSAARAISEGLWDKGAARELRKALAGMPHGETVVHFHSFVDALSASVPAVALGSGFPVAFTLHDYNFGCPYGGFYDYRRERICPLKGLSGKCWRTNCTTSAYSKKLWRNSRLWLQNRRLDLTGSTFVFVSKFSQRLIQSYLTLKSNRAIVLNPIEVEKGEPARPSGSEAFAFLGRLSVEKGPHLFADSASKAGVRALFIGDGPMKDRIRSINPDAELTGWLSKARAHERLRMCRAAVFPSLWYEAAPLAVQEAMALGLPVIVSDACAGREVVDPGETGLLFRNGDVVDLAEKLGELSEGAFADRLGKNAYEKFWSDPPTMDSHVDALLRLYQSMLGGWG